jgi:hypothetical protein
MVIYKNKSYDKDFNLAKTLLEYERSLIHKIPGVVGSGISNSDITGIGNGYHLVVYLEKEDQTIINQLPVKIYNIPVTYKIKGQVKILNSSSNGFTERYRPIRGGASVSTAFVMAGTGTIAGFPQLPNGDYVILSNNHAIAHDNPGQHFGQLGDKIIQPGIGDNGTNNDIVGTLAKWVKIFPESDSIFGINKVDCAYATIDPGISFNNINLCGFHINYSVSPILGMTIKKAGKATGCTFGSIDALDVSIRVDYSYTDTPYYGVFTGQIETSPNFIQEGDSGAAVVTLDTENAVGLVFASGSDGSGICNIMSDVESTLGVSFGNPPLSYTGLIVLSGCFAMGGVLYLNSIK